MKYVFRLCLRLGYLPRWSWFASRARSAILVPLHPRDTASGMNMIDLGANATPRQVELFQRWWNEVTSEPC